MSPTGPAGRAGMVRLGSGVLRSARTRGLRVLSGVGVRSFGEGAGLDVGGIGTGVAVGGCGEGEGVEDGSTVGVAVAVAVIAGTLVGVGVEGLGVGSAGGVSARVGSRSGRWSVFGAADPPGLSAPSTAIISAARIKPGTGRSVHNAIPFV